MKVICTRGNSKLVKGCTYDVLSINTLNSNNYKWFRPTVRVKINEKILSFSPNNFQCMDGTSIPEKNWESIEYREIKSSVTSHMYIKDVRDIKKGDIVVCRHASTIFEEGKMYKVSDVLYKESKSISGSFPIINQKIKIEGSNRWISNYRFRMLTAQEQRTLSLGSIFDEESTDIQNLNDIKSVRKIDRLSEKDRTTLLISSLLSSITDQSRNSLTIIEWAVQKKTKGYGVTIDDYKLLLNSKLKDIIKIVE